MLFSGAAPGRVISPDCQSTAALVDLSQGKPRMMCSFPRFVTRSRVRVDIPATTRLVRTQWVMNPCWLGVPSTLKTGMGLSSGDTGMFWVAAYTPSMNVPPAPESTRARVSMVRSVVIETGIRIDWSDTCATITGEIVTLGCSDIETGSLFKNPPFQRCSPPPLSRRRTGWRIRLGCGTWGAEEWSQGWEEEPRRAWG